MTPTREHKKQQQQQPATTFYRCEYENYYLPDLLIRDERGVGERGCRPLDRCVGLRRRERGRVCVRARASENGDA